MNLELWRRKKETKQPKSIVKITQQQGARSVYHGLVTIGDAVSKPNNLVFAKLSTACGFYQAKQNSSTTMSKQEEKKWLHLLLFRERNISSLNDVLTSSNINMCCDLLELEVSVIEGEDGAPLWTAALSSTGLLLQQVSASAPGDPDSDPRCDQSDDQPVLSGLATAVSDQLVKLGAWAVA
ncbi:hypothetical protein RRG08_013591 [Elysia crispata]|uniref:Uncharacterized protein n=1 Tax=Elysia crispata TaxID=231223 RepID=A0AAE0Y269_9GAST|nr:hypothetical protein RRG08_013591 [Elysia crispata]